MPAPQNQTIYLTAALLTGVLLTLGFKDFYPDLERRFRRAGKSRSPPSDALRDSEGGDDGIELREDGAGIERARGAGDGIEATIGETPVFRVRSLSDATGCEVLAKAEVCLRVAAG